MRVYPDHVVAGAALSDPRLVIQIKTPRRPSLGVSSQLLHFSYLACCIMCSYDMSIMLYKGFLLLLRHAIVQRLCLVCMMCEVQCQGCATVVFGKLLAANGTIGLANNRLLATSSH